jgi:hypothetical protein
MWLGKLNGLGFCGRALNRLYLHVVDAKSLVRMKLIGDIRLWLTGCLL